MKQLLCYYYIYGCVGVCVVEMSYCLLRVVVCKVLVQAPIGPEWKPHEYARRLEAWSSDCTAAYAARFIAERDGDGDAASSKVIGDACTVWEGMTTKEERETIRTGLVREALLSNKSKRGIEWNRQGCYTCGHFAVTADGVVEEQSPEYTVVYFSDDAVAANGVERVCSEAVHCRDSLYQAVRRRCDRRPVDFLE